MELNPKGSVDPNKMVQNKEGALVWKDNPYRAAILAGMQLNLRPRRSFYYTDEERFLDFLTTLEELYVTDPEFLEALVPYLRLEHGRKLAPMVVLGFLLAKSGNYRYLPQFISAKIIDTPKRMAEVVAVYRLISGKASFASIPYKERFKKVLESYSAYTLKKNRMRRRKIKLADLIKVFRPKPVDEEMSKLYKAIIENDPYASLKEDEHITATLSSNRLSQEKKQQIIEQSIESMPFNALVRNLRQFKDSSLDTKLRIRARFQSVLEGLKKGDWRVVDPFALFELYLSSYWDEFGVLQDIVAELIDSYVEYWSNCLELKQKKAAYLLDMSGSMRFDYATRELTGIQIALQAMAVLSQIYGFEGFAAFNNNLITEDEVIELVRNRWSSFGNTKVVKKVNDVFTQPGGAFTKFRQFRGLLLQEPDGATALVDAFEKFVKLYPDADVYIVLTDEVTWADKHATFSLEFLPKKTLQKVVIVNVDYNARFGGVVIQNPQLLRISQLTPGVFSYLQLWDGDIEKLVEKIKVKYLVNHQC